MDATRRCLLCGAPSEIVAKYVRNEQPGLQYWYGLCDDCGRNPATPDRVELVIKVNLLN